MACSPSELLEFFANLSELGFFYSYCMGYRWIRLTVPPSVHNRQKFLGSLRLRRQTLDETISERLLSPTTVLVSTSLANKKLRK